MELRKQRKRMKILLGCMIALFLVFGTLFMIGYTGKQMISEATETVDSFSFFIISALHEHEDTIIGIIVGLFVLLIIVMIILSWIPKTEHSPAYGGY